jgi:hypothetical protein
MPFRVAGHAAWIEICLLVADGATHGGSTMAIGAALDRRLVRPPVFTLERVIAGRMAVDATGMRQHFSELSEQGR